MRPKRKILYIHHGSGIGGAPLSLLYLIEKLDRNIFEPKVLFLTDSEIVNLFKSKNIDVRVIQLKNYLFLHMEPAWYRIYNPWRFFRDFFNQLFLIKKISLQILEEEKPDLLHLNSLFLITWAIAAKKLNIPTILHVREPLAKGYIGFRRKVFAYLINKYCDKVIAISEDNLVRLKIKKGHGVVVYNFVDFKIFNKNKTYPDQFNKNDNELIILYLGGRIKYKGFHEVVNCLKYLNENIRIVFAGYYKSSQSVKLRNPVRYYYLKKMNDSPKAIVLDVSHQIPSLIHKSDIIIFPSNKPHFARPIIEAFAMGKPVIVSDIEGNNETVKDGVNGLFFKNKSAQDLAAKINYLAANKEEREKYGNNGFNYAYHTFNADINAKQTIDLYYGLINGER